ncbi:TPM domain-containing protein [Paludisphaera mucosa]|uniref:TPM domain-containing protein n=1 Tax=Paludisphaera mucosa TaxID=3030827 RepID=A0ABT6FG20_9BACT|nr:hypothetical protein [Paludisphaera mucosa]MDG3006343.1 hypothetical protein [Paludisphaera mucosa]
MSTIFAAKRRPFFLLWVAAMVGAVRAEEASPMPAFTGERLYVQGAADRYAPVADAIRSLESRSPQSYYVVVVKSSGEGQSATRAFAERLRDAWRGEAATRGEKLDLDRAVIVVTALDNHQVSVLPGATLAGRIGLKGAVIDREIVEPRFIPLARAGDYPGALVALLNGVDEYVTAHEAAQAPVAGTGEVKTTTAAPSAPPTRLHGPAGSDLAWSLAGSFAAIALMIAGLVWLGRRRARGSFNAKLKDYKGKAVAMMDRLDGLKARLKSLPVEDPDFTEPMTGDTLALYQKAQEDLKGLWDRWLEVMDVVDRAQKQGAKGSKAMAEAEALVSEAKVFDEVEQGAQACAQTMDRLNAAHDEARVTVQAVVEIREQAAARVKAVHSAGLPTVPYQPEVDRLEAQAGQAAAILARDPLGAKSILERTKAEGDALVLRASDVVARLGDGKKVQEAIAKLRAEVAEHRRGGLRLAEEGGDPDPPSSQSEQALARLQAALEAGDPALAGQELAAGRTLLDQARGVLHAVVKAKAFVERGLDESRRETRRLREAVNQYAAFEQELKSDFAPASWQAVSGNLHQARTLLETFERKADEVEEAADPKTQKYLLAARLLGRLGLEQKAVFQLMNAVGEQLTGLKGVREESKRLADDLATRDRDVRRFFAQYDHVVGGQARESLQAAAKAREKAIRTTSTSQPDWPSARRALAEAREEYGIALSQAQSDLDVYQLLTTEYDQARQLASRVEAFLAGHSEDRLAANQHFRHAQEVLDLVGNDSTRVGNEWPMLLDQVRGAKSDLEHSERLAHEDVRLARQAESEISEAVRTLREGRTYLSMGVALDTSPAESSLDQAQGLYHSQEYEQAIRAAGSSIQQVRQAHQSAVQQAYVRQMQIAAEQRRRSVAMQNFGMGAAIGAAGAMMGGAAMAGEPDDREQPVADAVESDASSSSWSTEASESTW